MNANGNVLRSTSIGAGSLRMTNPSTWLWRAKRNFTKTGAEAAKYHAFANELAGAGVNGGTLHFDLILRKNTAISGTTSSFWGVQYNLSINQTPPSGSGWVQKTFLQLAASEFPPTQNVTIYPISLPLRAWSENTDELRIHPDSSWFELQFGSNFGSANTAEWHIDNLRVVSNTGPENQPPVFSSNPLTRKDAIAGVPYSTDSLAISAHDPDSGDTTIFSKVSGPAWLIVQADGNLGGTPSVADSGVNSFGVRVTDNSGLTAESTLLIDVISEPPPTSIQLEAETGDLTGVTLASASTGYSGIGYATGFNEASDKVRWSFPAPGGIYRLIIHYRSPFGMKGFSGSLNGGGISGTFPDSSSFATCDAGLVELNAGANTLEIGGGWNYYEIDAVTLTPEVPMMPLPVPAIPCDPLATQTARSLLARVTASYGSLTLSGQHGITDTSHIFGVSGEQPAIIEGDLMNYSPSRIEYGQNPGSYTETILARHSAGHLVQMAWHWNAPTDLINNVDKEWWRGFYTYATTFDVAAALADPSSENYALILRDMDAIAVQLKKAADADIPILWRPLHESEGGWFWWGAKGPGPFKELWRLLYHRLTIHHGLHNLIWVLTSEDPDWYPGHDVVDVVGVDAYPDNHSDALSSRWVPLLERFDGVKPLALTEFGGVPDIERMHRVGVTWAWFCSWSGSLGPSSESDEKLMRIYQSAGVVTLDELIPANRAPAFASDLLYKAAAMAGASYAGLSLATDASDPDDGELLAFAKIAGPDWLTVASDGTLGGIPAIGDAGINQFTVRANDSRGLVAGATLQVIVDLTNLQSWKLAEFRSDADNPLIAGEFANPDSDEFNNLMEYALGINPNLANSSPITCELVGEPASLRMTVPRNLLATDITFTVQVTDDLMDPLAWNSQETMIISGPPERLVVQDTGSGANRFMRLQIIRESSN